MDFELAKSVGAYFRLNEAEMDTILIEVRDVVNDWEKVAIEIGIKRREIEIMEGAFSVWE